MSYTEILRIEIPASVYTIGMAITRALDPDVGGAESWSPIPSSSENTVELPVTGYTTETPCTPEFKEQALAMIGNPALLHAAVCADYAARWADLTPPTLEECEAFCAGAMVSDPTASDNRVS